MRFPSASQQLTFSASEKGTWFKWGDRFSVLFIFSVLFFLETTSSEHIITSAFCWCLHDKGCQESERTLATKESEVVSWTSFSRGHFEKDERWFFNFQPLTGSSNLVCFSQKIHSHNNTFPVRTTSNLCSWLMTTHDSSLCQVSWVRMHSLARLARAFSGQVFFFLSEWPSWIDPRVEVRILLSGEISFSAIFTGESHWH